MPRKPNYGLNKHRKEQDRKAKKDAKVMDRQQRREQALPATNIVSNPDGAAVETPLPLPPNEEL